MIQPTGGRGRPHKLTLDFFVHDCKASGSDKIRLLSRRHGNDGYATFFRMLEILCQQDGLQLDLSSSLVAELKAEDCHLRDAQHLFSIIESCVEFGLFDRQLWESERIVLCPGLYKRYLGRLEERQKTAERKKRQREAGQIAERISEVQETFPKGKSIVTPKKVIVTPDNSPEYRDQNTELELELELETENLNPNQHAYACSAPEVEVLGKSFPQPEPSKSGETIRPVDHQRLNTSQQTVTKDMGSAAVLKVAKSQIDYERFREVYNAERPPLWAELQVVNDKRQKVFRQLVKDCGGQENALVALASALTFARSDGWWNTKNLSFENFATNGKILQLHERQTTLQASGLPSITPSIQKSLQVRSQVARALAQFRTQEVGQ